MERNTRGADRAKSNSPVLTLHWGALEQIAKTIGSLAAETGGAIGGSGGGTVGSHFQFDVTSQNSGVTYSPDHRLLNHLFKTEWNPNGIRLVGFVHSHPGSMGRPSCGDETYAERILKAIEDLHYLWLPIINTVPDAGEFRLTPWVARPAKRGVSVVRGRITVVPGCLERIPDILDMKLFGEKMFEAVHFGRPVDEIVIGRTPRTISRTVVVTPPTAKNAALAVLDGQEILQRSEDRRAVNFSKPEMAFDERITFNRVQDAYDLALMRTSRIIAVGAGGAASWLEELARAGVGQFIMIDPDVVSETNLATQQTYRRDIGRPKVDCIAERIRDINPMAKTIALQKSLDDLTDEEVRRLADDSIDGRETRRTVICGLTDDFFAQARVNRLALQLGLPSLSAQVYKEGRGAEITFTYPGVTPACHRCILSSRYRHFLEQERTNNVTSHGTPIFSTTRLNAIKGFVTVGLLHHGSGHPRWGDMISRIGKRNLIQIRMDPDFAETMGMSVFSRVFEKADHDRLFFDEVIWLPQDQECPENGYPTCPDCGGTGDLRDSIGGIEDTNLAADAGNAKASGNPNGEAGALGTAEAPEEVGD